MPSTQNYVPTVGIIITANFSFKLSGLLKSQRRLKAKIGIMKIDQYLGLNVVSNYSSFEKKDKR